MNTLYIVTIKSEPSSRPIEVEFEELDKAIGFASTLLKGAEGNDINKALDVSITTWTVIHGERVTE